MTTTTNQLLTPPEVAEMLGVPVNTLYMWRNRRTGPPAVKIGKHIRYQSSDLDSWINEQPQWGRPRTPTLISPIEITEILASIGELVPLRSWTPPDDCDWELRAAAALIAETVRDSVRVFDNKFAVFRRSFAVWTDWDNEGQLILSVWLGIERDPGMNLVGYVAVDA